MIAQEPPAVDTHASAASPGPVMSLRFKAMASEVTLQVVEPGPGATEALDAARSVFAQVEATCTRFDPASALMRANAAADAWCQVPGECFAALSEAARAHRVTDGLFDPRVLTALVELGYDRTLPFADGTVTLSSGTDPATPPAATLRPAETSARPAARAPWVPGLDGSTGTVRIGPHPVDLGGIGKGLAVRWAAEVLRPAGRAHLIEAGGDCHLGGSGPERSGWRVAVEDPTGGADALAVLTLTDAGCATSSLRIRSWRRDGRLVHHLIDPRSGTSAAGGLASVTVVDPDPATAEVWSKSLLIAGRDEVAPLAGRHALAAFWVEDNGDVGWSRALEPALLWVGARVR